MGDIRDAFGEFVNAQWPAADTFEAPPPFVWPNSPVPVILDCWRRFRAEVLRESLGEPGEVGKWWDRPRVSRDDLVETAKWLKFLLSAVRRSDFETQRYYPWLHKLGQEMCAARVAWTVRHWWTCSARDRVWARTLEPDVRPGETTIEPPEHYTPDDLPHPADPIANLLGPDCVVEDLPLQTISDLENSEVYGEPLREKPSPVQLATMKRAMGMRSGLVPVTEAMDGRQLKGKHKRCAWVSWPKAIDCPAIRAAARNQVGRIRPAI